MNIALTRVRPAVSEAEVDRRMAFADAALGAAGHAVTDPQITAVRRRAIQGELICHVGDVTPCLAGFTSTPVRLRRPKEVAQERS